MQQQQQQQPTTEKKMMKESLGQLGKIKLKDSPYWSKAIERIQEYYKSLADKTLDEVFTAVGNRNGLPFSTQVLGNIRLVNSGSIAQSFQAWRAKNPAGDISRWICDNIYALSAKELQELKEKQKHEAEVLNTAEGLLSGMSILGKPTAEIIQKAKENIVSKFGDEVFNKLLELVA